MSGRRSHSEAMSEMMMMMMKVCNCIYYVLHVAMFALVTSLAM